MSFAQAHGQLLLSAIRQQPEFLAFSDIPAGMAALDGPFGIDPNGHVWLAESLLAAPQALGFYLRHALEFTYLAGAGLAPCRAMLAAARAAAQFVLAEPYQPAEPFQVAEPDQLAPPPPPPPPAAPPAPVAPVALAGLPGWVGVMAQEVAPSAAQLRAVVAALPCGAAINTDADEDITEADIAIMRSGWSLLGTAEALMETGGDIRLQTDPHTALNGYGCSHRPRPWAVTFASSTASSSSERGYEAADRRRLEVTVGILTGNVRAPVRNSLQAVRRGIGLLFNLPAGAEVVLAASGTDTELLALAVTHLAPTAQPVLNILIAPEETGRGVPMAARGSHFAVDTALGHDVTFEAPIDGFRADTCLGSIALRGTDGLVRDSAAVEADIEAMLEAGLGAGQRVILHVLDLSKTGLLAPHPAFLGRMRAVHGDRFDIVVDACQTRLSAAAVGAYLALDATVLITGSKFFTGPPFAGAALLAPAIAARLRHAALPPGLNAYFGRDEFPEFCPAAEHLPPLGNYGLALRWHAALAEMRAFMRVPLALREKIISQFGAVVKREVAANPAFALLAAPKIRRWADDEPWERLASIFSISIRSAREAERWLTPPQARLMYQWLNTDLSAILPQAGSLATRICHIGQPVTLPQPGGKEQGVLRISAGARLISGEPSHKGLNPKTRLQRELDDVAVVFQKMSLILAHWDVLEAASPVARYRPAARGALVPHENVTR